MTMSSMRPRTPLLIMVGVHVVAIVIFCLLVGIDAAKPTGEQDRFAIAAGWFLAGVLIAPLVTIAAIVWSVLLRRRFRRPPQPAIRQTLPSAAPPLPPGPPSRGRTEAPSEGSALPSGSAATTRAQARAAAVRVSAPTPAAPLSAASEYQTARQPPARHRTSSEPYALLGSEKYKSTEIEGEFARTTEIATAIKYLTGSTLRLDHEVELTDVSAVLRTEPHNAYHRRAIRVEIAGSHVGYLARDDADRYHAAISRIERAGYAPETKARLWAVKRRGWDGPTKVHARVSLALNEPHLLHPVNEPPLVEYSLIPWGNAVQVSGEENHLEAIAPHVIPGLESIAIGTLHRIETHSARGVVKQTVEVRIDDRAVGSLTATTSPHFLPTIEHLEKDGRTAAAWVKIKGSVIAAQVTVQAARAPELHPDWFLAPTLIPPLS